MAKRPKSRSTKPVRDVAAEEESKFLPLHEVAALGSYIDAEIERLSSLLEPLPGVVIEAGSDVWKRLRNLFAVRILLRSGFRRFELCAASCGDFEDGAEPKLFTTGKGNRRSYTPLPAPGAVTIRQWLALKRIVGEDVTTGAPLLCGRNGEFMSFELLRQAWKEVLRGAGLPARKLHSSRHTSGLIVYAATGDIKMVGRFLRHEGTRITERVYLHVDLAALRGQLADGRIWA